jgi:Flp pilus assembly protein TadG
MDRRSRRGLDRHPERGSVLVLLAISMVCLLGFVALAVDLGYFLVTRNEVQNVADYAALAATRQLGAIYQGLPGEEQETFFCDQGCQDLLEGVAQEVATKNRAGGQAMTVRVEDVLIGQWNLGTFTETNDWPDAVQVVARRDEVANGPVATFFARVLGIDEGGVTAMAIAAMTGQGTAGPGDLELPIGISAYFFQPGAFCDQDIQFYPTNDPASCAGWTSWEYGSNDAVIRKILQENDRYPSPGTTAGESVFNFTGGTLSEPTFDALLSLFQNYGSATRADGEFLIDPDDGGRVTAAEAAANPSKYGAVELWEDEGAGVQAEYPDGMLRYLHKWETGVVVYDRLDCSNPNQSIKIVGFAQIELVDVLNAPDKLVRGVLICNRVSGGDNRGGGGNYGTKGPIPGLVW